MYEQPFEETRPVRDVGIQHNVERNGSGVQLRTIDYENPGSNPVLRC